MDTLPPHHHDRTVVGVTISGERDSVVGSRTLSNRGGVLHTEPAGDTHSNHFGPQGTHVFIVQPDPAATELLEPCRAVLTQVHQLIPEGARTLAGRLVRELSCPDDLSSMALEAGCLELLATASRLTLHRTAQHPAWLLRIADYVRAEFRRTPKLEEFAAVAGVHPSHVVREFKRAFGETPASRIRRFRLEWAAPRVSGTDEPLASIAAAAGFGDQSHFTRQFHRHFGVTPVAYRRGTRKL